MTGTVFDPFLGLRMRLPTEPESAAYMVDVSKFGVIGDGSNEASKLQAAFDAAKALADTLDQSLFSRPQRVTVYCPPGLKIDIGTTSLVAGSHLIDVDFTGSTLISRIVTGAALTLGVVGKLWSGTFRIGYIDRIVPTADQWLANDTVGLKVYNACQPVETIVGKISGFRACVQFRAEWGGTLVGRSAATFAVDFEAATLKGKYGIHVLCVDSPGGVNTGNGAWANSNRFLIKDCQMWDGGNFGIGAGVCFESLNNDTASVYAMRNKVEGCFQLGNVGGNGWVAGQTITAADVGRGYTSNGYSYIATQAGVCASTPLHQISIAPGREITSGGAKFLVEGQYLRTPIFCKNAGTMIEVDLWYNESGYGGVFHQQGPYLGGGHTFKGMPDQVLPGGDYPWFSEIKALGQWIPFTNNKVLTDFYVGWRFNARGINYVLLTPGTTHSSISPASQTTTDGTVITNGTCTFRCEKSSGVLKAPFGQNVGKVSMNANQGGSFSTPAPLISDNWHKIAINSSLGWYGEGIVFSDGLGGGFTDNTTHIRLSRSGLLGDGGWKGMPGLVLNNRDYHTFRFQPRKGPGGTKSPRYALSVFDAAGTRLNVTDYPPLGMVDNSYSPSGYNYRVTDEGKDEHWVKLDPSVDHAVFSLSYCNLGSAADEGVPVINGFTVQAYADRTQFYTANPYEGFPDSSKPRFARAEPTEGFFPKRGEIIYNLNATGLVGDVWGWIVSVPGVKARAYVNTTAVGFEELRSNGGKVYYVDAPGTTTNVAPTGTTTSVDGSLTWHYLAPEAVLLPLVKAIPPSQDLSLNDFSAAAFDASNWNVSKDSDADGLADGFDRSTSFGPLTGISTIQSVAANKFSISETFTSQNGGGYWWRCYSDALVVGHKYALIYDVENVTGLVKYLGTNHTINGVTHQILYGKTDSEFFVKTGDTTRGIGGNTFKALDDGIIQAIVTFTASATTPAELKHNLDGGFIPTYPQTYTARFKGLWLVDLTAAETSLGITLPTSASELWPILYPSLSAPSPSSISLTDTVTGGKVILSINNGVVTVS